jgi:hypothetical protein
MEILVKFAIMKRFLLSLFVTMSSIFVWGQSSVVQMGEAVVRCNNFPFAKTMLMNEGLSVDKTSKLNSANCIVLTNAPTDNLHYLSVVMRKQPKSKKIKNIVFTFSPNGIFYSELGSEAIRLEYRLDNDTKSSFKELYSNGQKHMGLDFNSRGWMVATFYRDTK